jgi:beta-glucanase (GH16 family)
MMKKLLFFLLILAACTSEKKDDWKLVWSDEFDNAGLPDENNWGNEVGFIRNHELQYYTKRRSENSVVGNGQLMIIGRKEQFDTAGYTSASLTTDGKHSWTYGKIEAKMKLPVGQGICCCARRSSELRAGIFSRRCSHAICLKSFAQSMRGRADG